jgi:hypothetical protein
VGTLTSLTQLKELEWVPRQAAELGAPMQMVMTEVHQARDYRWTQRGVQASLQVLVRRQVLVQVSSPAPMQLWTMIQHVALQWMWELVHVQTQKLLVHPQQSVTRT